MDIRYTKCWVCGNKQVPFDGICDCVKKISKDKRKIPFDNCNLTIFTLHDNDTLIFHVPVEKADQITEESIVFIQECFKHKNILFMDKEISISVIKEGENAKNTKE